jgi:hypothetical protein
MTQEQMARRLKESGAEKITSSGAVADFANRARGSRHSWSTGVFKASGNIDGLPN